MSHLLPPFPPTLADLRTSHSFSDTAHWVIPGILMQGGRPHPSQIGDILQRTNCRTFVCLQAECVSESGAILLGDGGDRDWGCDTLELPTYGDEVRSATAGTPSVFLHYGIRDMNPAKSIEGLMHVVSQLASRIRSEETIYLHCWGGKGRAGLVAACLLIELYGSNVVDAEMALQFISAVCQLRNIDGKENVHYSSPETEDQREQVREFYRRVTPGKL